jgi:SAM-dependent methyltransferase
VDFSEVAIERARKLAARRGVDIEWLREDLASYAPPEGAFQLVLIAYLQAPGAELRRVLARVAGALAPGGELLMIGHARRNLSKGVGGPRDPAVLWTPDEIDSALEALALSVERCEHVLRSVDTPDGLQQEVDVLARARRPG